MCKWFTWFCGKVFDEFEARDFLVILIVSGLFLLIACNKLPMERMDAILTGVVAYSLGRPDSWGGNKRE